MFSKFKTLKDFVNQTDIVVEFKDKTIKTKRSGTVNFDDKIVLLNNVKLNYCGKLVTFQYRSKGVFTGGYLDIDTPAKKASLLKEKRHRFEIKSDMTKNLDKSIPRSRGVITIGCDPEIFVTKDGVVVPAFKFLGSKDKPNVVKSSQDRTNNVYWDGFQAEYDTTANSCLAYHVDSIQNGLKGIHDLAKKYDKDAELSLKPTLDIPAEMLASAEAKHVEFGCMPSMNAYGHEGMKASGRETTFRSAGGHIHFGLSADMKKEEKITRAVKMLDAILGVASVSLFAGYEDHRRRLMYGLAGEYRTPKHGLEYRTLSNVWLCHPMITHLVFDLSRKCVELVYHNLDDVWKASEKEIVQTINGLDVEQARKILKRNSKVFKQILKAIYRESSEGDALDKSVELIYNVWMTGIDSVIQKPTDIVGNWNIKTEWQGHSDGPNKSWQTARAIALTGKKVS